MASLIDDSRKEKYEILRLRKRRADQINHWCFILICANILYAGISLLLMLTGDPKRIVFTLCLIFIRINNGQFPKVTLFR